MLKLNLSHAGHKSTVELNGQDISRFVRSVSVRTGVSKVTAATIEYTGAVVVEGDGVVTLHQAEHLATCRHCAKTLSGERQDDHLIDTTRLQSENKTYEHVD